MSPESLIRSVLPEAIADVDRRIRTGELWIHTAESRLDLIVHAAVQICLERSPEIARRMVRSRLLEIVNAEVGGN